MPGPSQRNIALHQKLAGVVEPEPAETGLHLVAWLPEDANDVAIAERAATFGVTVEPLSRFRIAAQLRPGLVLGFGGVRPDLIRPAVDRLAMALNTSSLKPGEADLSAMRLSKSEKNQIEVVRRVFL